MASLASQLGFTLQICFNAPTERAVPLVVIGLRKFVSFRVTFAFCRCEVPRLKVDPRLLAPYLRRFKTSSRCRISVETFSNPLKGFCLTCTE
jgi:hypothetical protein